MGRTRDAIFKILDSGSFAGFLDGAKFVDLFCGSGAVALEALSRGARHAVMIDENPEYLNLARMNAELLGESNNITVLHTSIPCNNTSNLRKAIQDSNIVFADAPYGSGLTNEILLMLSKNGFMRADSIIVLEVSKTENIDLLPGFEILTDRFYGRSHILIVKKLIQEVCGFE
jgi:16S rRNA (guanine966-N2)-methyltransferase